MQVKLNGGFVTIRRNGTFFLERNKIMDKREKNNKLKSLIKKMLVTTAIAGSVYIGTGVARIFKQQKEGMKKTELVMNKIDSGENRWANRYVVDSYFCTAKNDVLILGSEDGSYTLIKTNEENDILNVDIINNAKTYQESHLRPSSKEVVQNCAYIHCYATLDGQGHVLKEFDTNEDGQYCYGREVAYDKDGKVTDIYFGTGEMIMNDDWGLSVGWNQNDLKDIDSSAHFSYDGDTLKQISFEKGEIKHDVDLNVSLKQGLMSTVVGYANLLNEESDITSVTAANINNKTAQAYVKKGVTPEKDAQFYLNYASFGNQAQNVR